MTIEEVIRHCEEVAEQKEADSFIDRWTDGDEWSESIKEDYRQCAAEHRQLAEWLKELKERRAADVQPVKRGEWIEHSDWIECNVCGFEVNDTYCEKRDKTCTETSYDYCPKCGADMREPEAIKG